MVGFPAGPPLYTERCATYIPSMGSHQASLACAPLRPCSSPKRLLALLGGGGGTGPFFVGSSWSKCCDPACPCLTLVLTRPGPTHSWPEIELSALTHATQACRGSYCWDRCQHCKAAHPWPIPKEFPPSLQLHHVYLAASLASCTILSTLLINEGFMDPSQLGYFLCSCLLAFVFSATFPCTLCVQGPWYVFTRVALLLLQGSQGSGGSKRQYLYPQKMSLRPGFFIKMLRLSSRWSRPFLQDTGF
jgi:hypothetical protein